MSSAEATPVQIQAKVFIRYGMPLTDVRRGTRTPFLLTIDPDETLYLMAARIRDGLVQANPDLDLPNQIELYLKTSTNCRQTNYLLLLETNWPATLTAMLTKFRRRSVSERHLELYVYVENEPITRAQTSQTSRRATTARVQAAATAIQQHVANLPPEDRPGPLQMRYLAEYNARRPDSAPLQLPDNPVTHQMRALDALDEESEQRPATVTLRMLWSDVWIPVQFDASDFMRAFITQNAEERRQILRENFATVAVNQMDVDHEE